MLTRHLRRHGKDLAWLAAWTLVQSLPALASGWSLAQATTQFLVATPRLASPGSPCSPRPRGARSGRSVPGNVYLRVGATRRAVPRRPCHGHRGRRARPPGPGLRGADDAPGGNRPRLARRRTGRRLHVRVHDGGHGRRPRHLAARHAAVRDPAAACLDTPAAAAAPPVRRASARCRPRRGERGGRGVASGRRRARHHRLRRRGPRPLAGLGLHIARQGRRPCAGSPSPVRRACYASRPAAGCRCSSCSPPPPGMLRHGASPGDIVGAVTYVTGSLRAALYTLSQGMGGMPALSGST